MKTYRDMQNSLTTAKMEGRIEGEAIGEAKRTREVAINLIKKGLDTVFIKEVTELLEHEIETLRNELANS